MSSYNIFQALYMSFYSRKLYEDVGKNWGGKVFLYLFVLLALSWIGQTAIMQSGLNRIYAQASDEFMAQLPLVIIENGKVTTPENRPYIIKDPNGTDVFAIIDTSGKYTDLSGAKSEVLVTKTKIYEQRNKHEVRIHQLPESLNITINPVSINDYIKRVIGFAWIFIFTFVVIISYIYRVLQVLLYSVLGKIFSTISSANVDYGTILQITIVALTPAIVLSTLLDLMSITIPHHNLLYFVIAMGYMIYGIQANKR